MPWFPYTDLGDGVPRPYLAVWRDPKIPLAALIDSGADGSSLPEPIAVLLGVKFDRTKPRIARGAGGPYDEWEAEDDVALECVAGPIILTRPAINPQLPLILIGRVDAFQQYRFGFDQRNLLFLIKPHAAPLPKN